MWKNTTRSKRPTYNELVYETTLNLQDRIQNSTIKFVDELDENIQLLYEDGHSDTDRASNIFINYECGNTNYRRLPSIVEISTSDLKMVDQSKYNHIVTSPTNDTVCELIRLNRRDEKLKKELDNEKKKNAKIINLIITIDDSHEKKFVEIKVNSDENLNLILSNLNGAGLVNVTY